jgi:hypothetical protein
MGSIGDLRRQPSFGSLSNKSFLTSKTNLDVKLRGLATTLSFEQHEDKQSIEQFRLKTKEFLTHSMIGEFYNNLLLLGSVFSCGQYLYGTYQEDDNEKDYIELGIAIIFTLDWCLNCFIADHKVLFFTR